MDEGLSNSKQEDASPTFIEVHKGRPIKLQARILVPVQDHPNFNFVGKLLGPKGNSLKRLQEATKTRMAILGKGSMRNKEKEEELRNQGDQKYSHLHENLHVDISTFAPASEAYARISHAIAEVKRFLVPDYYDDIRQHQLRELALMNGSRNRTAGSHEDVTNGTNVTSPLSSPSASSLPSEAPELHLPVPLASTAHTTLLRLTSAPHSGRSKMSRIPYACYRSSAAPGFRRVPLYGNLTPDAPTILLPEHEDEVFDENYSSEFYDAMLDTEFPSFSDGEKLDFAGTSPQNVIDRSNFSRNGFGACWKTTPRISAQRLKPIPVRPPSRTYHRNHPYPLPPCE